MIIRTSACARAALIGNPSDGYFGRTISFAMSDFKASVALWESPTLRILPSVRDRQEYESMEVLVKSIRTFGYYGGFRLVKASIKTFFEYCEEQGIALDGRNFTLQYSSTIPGLVGLSGSSAIVTATYRALMSFYGVTIPKPILANIIRSTEERELGIAAGLQDRVIQVYGGVIYMDFDKKLFDKRGYGEYKKIDPALLKNVYVGYCTDLGEMSGVYHNNLKARYNAGDKAVVDAMAFWRDITLEARECILKGDNKRLGELMNANFDKRAEISQISPQNLEMVKIARSCGASAKFPGSGGAIVGLYEDEAMFKRLQTRLAKKNVCVIKPTIAPFEK